MANYIVRIDSELYKVEASNKKSAKLKAARRKVARYPRANLDTRKVLNQYKIKVNLVGGNR